MIDLSAFYEHDVMINTDKENDNLESVVLLSLTKQGIAMHTTCFDIEDGYDVYRLLGALEALKSQILLQHTEFI